ncbi:MAG TPA: 6,7-dimethyl-8-ribityllumazine synthase [Dongiaceae bacterium]|jgi:6,7-dimethyl-8-ribityllumazine synthase|nr:6,7-dimethyl-8-ribityllumazine synthase [Dongiaceae bacterium]
MTRVLIIEARFYHDIAEAQFAGAEAALRAAGAEYERLAVPGALEIPGAIRMAHLAKAAYDGYLALGCVIRGETAHFDIVAQESARGLMDLVLVHGLAIGNGILTVEDEDQAWARARADRKDKGGEAARACLAMIALRRRWT